MFRHIGFCSETILPAAMAFSADWPGAGDAAAGFRPDQFRAAQGRHRYRRRSPRRGMPQATAFSRACTVLRSHSATIRASGFCRYSMACRSEIRPVPIRPTRSGGVGHCEVPCLQSALSGGGHDLAKFLQRVHPSPGPTGPRHRRPRSLRHRRHRSGGRHSGCRRRNSSSSTA